MPSSVASSFGCSEECQNDILCRNSSMSMHFSANAPHFALKEAVIRIASRNEHCGRPFFTDKAKKYSLFLPVLRCRLCNEHAGVVALAEALQIHCTRKEQTGRDGTFFCAEVS